MEDEQPVSTPLDPHLRLDGIAETALALRPGIAFAAAALCRYNANPQTGHITIARRVLRYLKTAADYQLYYRKSINGRLIGLQIPIGLAIEQTESLKADTSSV